MPPRDRGGFMFPTVNQHKLLPEYLKNIMKKINVWEILGEFS